MAEAKSGAGGGRICNASEACMDQLEAASFSPNLSPMQKEAVEDCLGRFKLWAGNLGALHKGRMSLDSRIGKSRLAQEVLNLLDELSGCLQFILAPNEGPVVDEVEDMDDVMSDILDTMSMTIRNLLKLSPMIRRNPNRDPWKRILALPPWDPEPMIDNVVQKWPKLRSSELARCLGLANARRRQFFQYRQSHVEKLARPIHKDANTVAESEGTVPTTFFGDDASVPIIGTRSVSGDNASDTTFATAFGQGVDSTMNIPPPPAGYEKQSVQWFYIRYFYFKQPIELLAN